MLSLTKVGCSFILTGQTDMKNAQSRKTPFLLLFLFLVLLLVGINVGEVSAVWEKAVRVCLSCIGIG
jgi:hypothetical protein